MMFAASRPILIPMLLLLNVALIYHPVAEAMPLEASNDDGFGIVTRSISPDDFKIGYAVEGTFLAPDRGRVHLNLIDDEGRNRLLHVDARYKTPGAGYPNTLITNSNINSEGWGKEEYLSGYDFTPGILVTLRVEAKDGYFRIIVNGQELGTFQYRVPDVTSVSRIQLRYRDYQAEQKAELRSLSIYYQ